MTLSIGQVLNNRYRIDALLGHGGMGALYRALDLNLNIPVAVKENLDASPEAQKQFGREAGMLARLSHPNLPRVSDYFFIPGQGQYLVMDFVEGQDLQTMLDLLGILPENKVLAWISQVCDALAYLHSQPQPIIHRDIKPANIRIRPDGRAMLVDFGIAKVYDPHLATTIGAKAVTPGYSPPEQYGGGITDTRSDIYALGATLYHLLTGQKLPESVLRATQQTPTAPPRRLNRQISPVAEQAILKAIDVATDRRFQSVDQLRTALAPLTPRQVPEIPQPSRGSSPARPFPLLLVLGGVGLVLVILIVAVALSGAFGARPAQPAATATVAPTATSPGVMPSVATATLIRPTATATSPVPTVTPIPLSVTPVQPTATTVPPTRVPTRVPVATPTTAPTAVQLELVSPSRGGGPYRNPIIFIWRGSLSAGQAYQVKYYQERRLDLVYQSGLLTTPSWTVDLPNSPYGEWRWQVSIVMNESVVSTSTEWHFYFNLLSGTPLPKQ